jgi:ribonuclease HI
MTTSKEPVANKELWEMLVAAEAKRKKFGAVTWHYVVGHVGHPGNERADTIATSFAKNEPTELFEGHASKYPVDMTAISTPKQQADRSSKKKHSKTKAYSYLALIDHKATRYSTWGECEAAVKGKSAKYKKSISADDEKNILKAWGAKL